jgi:hypothetical protein
MCRTSAKVKETRESKEQMERSEKWSDGIQNRVMRDTHERRVSHSQIVFLGTFDCKTHKTEEGMMGQFRGRFLYLRNSEKVAKYGIGKRSVELVFGIKD